MLINFNSEITRDDKYRGDVDVSVEVEANIIAEHDPYGTGDSPTSYEVELLSVTINDHNDFDDGQNVLSRLDQYTVTYLEEEATKEVQ